jgi:fructokinase
MTTPPGRPSPGAPAAGAAIVVAGEALIDLVVSANGELRAHPGGAPFNVARTIARLEQPAAYLGRISDDHFGARLRERLADDGVLPDAIVPTDLPTTLALAEVSPDGHVGYRFYVHGTSVPGLTATEALRALPPNPAMLYVSGVGLSFEPMATAMAALATAVADASLVVLDTNIRPWIMDDPDEFRRNLATLLPHADLVKASEEDMGWLEPGRDPAEAARALLRFGPSLVLLTMGPRGAIAMTAADDVTVPAPHVTVTDAIGAGDAFCGAFLAWWRSRGLGGEALTRIDTVAEATRFACLVAAMTCERAGASPPWLSEVTG